MGRLGQHHPVNGVPPAGRAPGRWRRGAEVIVRMATIGKDGPTGTFQEGQSELPW